jgi:FkbM family methyltransferase
MTFRPYVKNKTVEGVNFDFYFGSRTGYEWYDLYATDPNWPEMRHIRDLLIEPGDRVLEFGGHHGCTSVLLGNWVGPDGRVITFEPCRENYDILCRNVKINNLTNVETRHQAVGQTDGSTGIHQMAVVTETNENIGESVEMVSIDSLLDWKPTVLKLDIQGYEVKALRGAGRVLETRPKLAIEVHCGCLCQYGDSIEEMIELLDLDSYDSCVVYNDSPDLVPYDGNIERWRPYNYVHLFAKPKT